MPFPLPVHACFWWPLLEPSPARNLPHPFQSKLLEAELSKGELLAARDRALATAERAEARMKQVEKGVDEHR